MTFAPIRIEDYVPQYVEANPGTDPAEVEARLRDALADFRANVRCDCGGRLWVIGSAEAGNACFTCITGEAMPDEDYELAEVLEPQI